MWFISLDHVTLFIWSIIRNTHTLVKNSWPYLVAIQEKLCVTILFNISLSLYRQHTPYRKQGDYLTMLTSFFLQPGLAMLTWKRKRTLPRWNQLKRRKWTALKSEWKRQKVKAICCVCFIYLIWLANTKWA